jgi:hypothetical protein
MKVKVKKTRGTTGNQHNYGLVTGSIWNYEDKPTNNNVSVTLSPVPRDEANIEAERNETIVFPDQDGTVSHAKIGGKRHYQGGTPLNVPDGSFVFSDYNKMKIKNKDVLRDIFNMNPNKGATPAQIAKKYDIETYKKILKDPWADPMDKKTAQLMLENNMKKLGQLALIQESMKGFPDGIPAIAQPLFGSDIAQGQPSPQDQMPAQLAEARYGGLKRRQEGGEEQQPKQEVLKSEGFQIDQSKLRYLVDENGFAQTNEMGENLYSYPGWDSPIAFPDNDQTKSPVFQSQPIEIIANKKIPKENWVVSEDYDDGWHTDQTSGQAASAEDYFKNDLTLDNKEKERLKEELYKRAKKSKDDFKLKMFYKPKGSEEEYVVFIDNTGSFRVKTKDHYYNKSNGQERIENTGAIVPRRLPDDDPVQRAQVNSANEIYLRALLSGNKDAMTKAGEKLRNLEVTNSLETGMSNVNQFLRSTLELLPDAINYFIPGMEDYVGSVELNRQNPWTGTWQERVADMGNLLDRFTENRTDAASERKRLKGNIEKKLANNQKYAELKNLVIDYDKNPQKYDSNPDLAIKIGNLKQILSTFDSGATSFLKHPYSYSSFISDPEEGVGPGNKSRPGVLVDKYYDDIFGKGYLIYPTGYIPDFSSSSVSNGSSSAEVTKDSTTAAEGNPLDKKGEDVIPANNSTEKTGDDYGDENTMSKGTTTTQGTGQGTGQTQTVKVKKDTPAAPAIDYNNLSVDQMRALLVKNGYPVPADPDSVKAKYNRLSQYTEIKKSGGEQLRKYQTAGPAFPFIPDEDKPIISQTYDVQYAPGSLASSDDSLQGAPNQRGSGYMITPSGHFVLKSLYKSNPKVTDDYLNWEKSHPAFDWTGYDGGYDQYVNDLAEVGKLATKYRNQGKANFYELAAKEYGKDPNRWKAEQYDPYYAKHVGQGKSYYKRDAQGKYLASALIPGAQFVTDPIFTAKQKEEEEKKIIEEEKKEEEKKTTKQEEVPEGNYETGISPAPWWNYDVVNYANQLGNYFGIEQGQLPPYMQYNPYLADPTFVDPARAIAQQQGMARQSQDAIMSGADPTTGRANVIAAQAQAAPQVANIMSQYDNQNVGIANQFEQQNAQTMNQAQLQNQKFQQLYADEIATRRQQYLNALREGKTNVAKSIMQGMKNAAETSWENATSDSYAVDPTSGQVYFKRGFDPTTGSFRSSNSLSFTEWKKANGLDSYTGDESALIKAYTEYLRSNKSDRSRRRSGGDDDDKKMGGKVKKAKYLHGGIVFNPIDHIWNI